MFRFHFILKGILALAFVGLAYGGFKWGYSYVSTFDRETAATWSYPSHLTVTKVGSIATDSTDHTLSDSDAPLTRRFDSVMIASGANVIYRNHLEVDGDWQVGHQMSVRVNLHNGSVVPSENLIGITNPWIGAFMGAFLASVVGTALLATIFDIVFGIFPKGSAQENYA